MSIITRRPVPGQIENRARPSAGDLERRAAPDAAPTLDGPRLRGVIPYGIESSDLGGWREVIEPGALRNARTAGLIATVNHGGVPIARHPGTLQLEDRSDGMHWSLELPESRSDVREAVTRGDLCAGSWSMRVGRDEWRGNVRHVHEVTELRDVSVVSDPAYAASVVEHRSSPQPPPGPTPGPAPQRRTGGLRLEDRTADTGGSVETRVLAAMAGVARGESRALTAASVDPVEPDDLRTQLIDRLRETSVVLQSGVNVVATDKKAVHWPVLTSDVTPAFYDELDEITPTDLTFDEFTIPVKSIKALVRGSSEAFEDSSPDLLAIVNQNMNLALALKADRELVAGTDVKGFRGLLSIFGTQTIAVDGALSWDHVLKAVGLLIEARVPGPYAMLLGPRPATALSLVKELAASNAYLATPAGVPPIYNTSWLPVAVGTAPDPDTTSAVVYAPAQTTVVVRRDVTVEVDRSQEFSADAVLVRGKYRLGIDVPHAASIVKLTGLTAPPIAA